MQVVSQPSATFGDELTLRATECCLRPLHVLISAPSALFLVALTAMLLRHPDVQFYEIDRIAFGLLLAAMLGRTVILRQPLFVTRATWPMTAITLLALSSVGRQNFDHETWSVLASKILVPFALFHVSALVFTQEKHFRHFETFSVVVLAYLSFTAIAFLLGAHSLIFPRFILDANVGFHIDRARGPLLQAVANGVSLNLLGLLALHARRRASVRGIWVPILLASLPIAILATMTRAVWLSFAGTILALVFLARNRRWRFWGFISTAAIVAVGFVILTSCHQLSSALADRLEERGPVDFRKAVYAGSWEMFWQHPLFGCGFHCMPAELPRYVSGYIEKILYPHNTYLELLVELGLVGFAFYLWLMWELWRLAKGAIPVEERNGFLNSGFHRLWPLMLAIFWVNAAFVVMSYQFVNGLLFTMAGMLAAQRRRAQAALPS